MAAEEVQALNFYGRDDNSLEDIPASKQMLITDTNRHERSDILSGVVWGPVQGTEHGGLYA
jgi:hypothetical protein